ncbi:hypothetical protein PENTCL1PPCAC_10156, partial [Pristionchus entomophagus]
TVDEESLPSSPAPLRPTLRSRKQPATSNRSPPVVSIDSEEIYISSSLFPFGSAVAKTTRKQQQNGPYALDPNCNSSELREIIVQGISDTPSDSKHLINAAIARNLDGSFGIVCAECSFSYLAHTIQYCHHTTSRAWCSGMDDHRSIIP